MVCDKILENTVDFSDPKRKIKRMKNQKGMKLRSAFTLFLALIIISTITINWFSSTKALKKSLTENYLNSNEKYAQKLAASTNALITQMMSNMETLALLVGQQQITQKNLDNWRETNKFYFNSLFITDTKGTIKLISPSVVSGTVKAGGKMESEEFQKALESRKPYISNPHTSKSGHLLLIISTPIFDQKGTLKGLLNGTIFLDEKENAIYHMLSEHEQVDESYVYVVDKNGRILLHPDKNRLNHLVISNPVVKKVMKGKHGAQITVNTQGKEFFAAYAYVESTGWGIISQTPTTAINEPIKNLMKKIFMDSLPFLLIIYILGWKLVNRLSNPLVTLANYTENAFLENKHSNEPLQSIKFNSNIFEIRQLYTHINAYIRQLNILIQQDGLTGLANRRTFDFEIKRLFDEKIPFSVIMLDIDFFKRVNDTYGHLTGDDVLKALAQVISQFSGPNDLCFRYGGEEFGILLYEKNEQQAYNIAEKLRKEVLTMPTPMGESITISLGVSSYQKDDKFPKDVIKRADAALYESKLNGRNRTTIYKKKT